MKLSNKLIDNVISEVAGDDVIPLVRSLKNKKNVSEFKLADSIKQEINITRNMLYRLFNSNLVSFTRKKDKKKGWYVYYWTFNVKQIRYLIDSLKKKRLEKLKERLVREKESNFYVCPQKCIRLDFDQAMNFEFKCPECGSLIEQEDNEEKILQIEKQVIQIEKEIKNKLKMEKIQPSKKIKSKNIKIKKKQSLKKSKKKTSKRTKKRKFKKIKGSLKRIKSKKVKKNIKKVKHKKHRTKVKKRKSR